jgi:hypothetical protein
MIALDHIAMWTRNNYRSTYQLSQETGLGSFDGGFLPFHGIGQKVVPLGGDVFIEVEGIVDFDVFHQGSAITEAIARNTVDGDCFQAWCLRSDSLEDLEAFATHRGTKVQYGIVGGLIEMTGATDAGEMAIAPSVPESWMIGKPNMYHVPDLTNHWGSRRARPGTGTVLGGGVAWIEIGGTREDLVQWLGPVFDATEAAIDIRYNGRRPGLHAVGVKTTGGERVIRRQPPR